MLPLFISLLVLLGAGTDLYAKPPTDAAQQELVEITKVVASNGMVQNAFTVPTGKTLTIIDVNISTSLGETSGTNPCCAFILRNGVEISKASLRDRNYQRTYKTGIEFREGDIVGVQPPNSGGSVFFELRGFLADIN